MPKRLLAVAITLTVAGCGGGARPRAVAPSGGSYTAQVDTYLAREATAARNNGFTRAVAPPVHGVLDNLAKTTHDMDVIAGNQYILFGACDNDCTDLDLRIYNPDGTVLAQDIATDDIPTLIFQPTMSARYRIEVIMAHCNRNPCFYGVQLMAK
jgi:hypothetical protein